MSKVLFYMYADYNLFCPSWCYVVSGPEYRRASLMLKSSCVCMYAILIFSSDNGGLWPSLDPPATVFPEGLSHLTWLIFSTPKSLAHAEFSFLILLDFKIVILRVFSLIILTIVKIEAKNKMGYYQSVNDG